MKYITPLASAILCAILTDPWGTYTELTEARASH